MLHRISNLAYNKVAVLTATLFFTLQHRLCILRKKRNIYMNEFLISNYIDASVDVRLVNGLLTITIDDLVKTVTACDTDILNRAVDYCDPFKFNQGHLHLLLNNTTYDNAGDVYSSVLAQEYVIQFHHGTSLSRLKAMTEEQLLSMEQYRQYRCTKTLLSLCGKYFGGDKLPALYLSNYNLAFKIDTPKGTIAVIGCGFTLSPMDGNEGSGLYTMAESAIEINSSREIMPGFIFITELAYELVDMQLGTYVIKGSQ